ncbi:hypothetical protein MCOR27_003297 [Pyricularia oryzae]|uniref:BTB domain-containing protein n=1 Tax=Pyricularia grisea TaxID=148305 RepID=A0ABQ8NQK6_PYRGI|nr:hypothetical protein MCOR01_009218 [Pyricularia oryzae]KAI6300537.1 hypothetical protein MCOR33_003812 [Pyricularia grisea]KAH9439931.1 hypothetical protein MCOR02_003464 [Pyricularia oryzae]KAI6257388.1 hypothetical protein MCOR19_006184 [Pyricularia oryzae]KAI6268674.1 hypothetical protein MCOR26_009093 [Pyricularia oryzae]
MDVEHIDIDPDGDVLLVLKAPCTIESTSTSADSSGTSGSRSNDDDTAGSQNNDGDSSDKQDKDDHPSEKSVEILVSSYAVITASTVFKSMLQGPFKEGSDITEARKNGVVYRLALPEDNADATLLFCKIVHFKSDISTPNLELMEQLAVLCDKYKCHHILRFLGSMWLNEHRRNLQLESSRSRTCQQLGRLLIFAYVADMAQEFNELAWELLLHNTGGINSYNSCVLFLIDHPLVPKKVITYLDKRRTQIAREYFDAMYGPFNRKEWPHAGTGCDHGEHKLQGYIRLMNDKKWFES